MATLAQPRTSRAGRISRRRTFSSRQVKDYEQVDREILAILKPTKAWFGGLLAVAILACLGPGRLLWTYQIHQGLGVRGLQPAGDVGRLHHHVRVLGRYRSRRHAHLRHSVSLPRRLPHHDLSCAEAMTVFAVMTAGLFPIIHIGRPWKFFWLIPYPNWRLIWPNFKSPLVWDVFAISTYLTISATFLFVGLIPDIAVLRDRETNPIRKRSSRCSSPSAGGNTEREWRHFARAYLFLAGVLHAARALGALGRVVRLRDGHRAGLAHDDLPAVLRRWCDLLRVRRWCGRSSSRCAAGSMASPLRHA